MRQCLPAVSQHFPAIGTLNHLLQVRHHLMSNGAGCADIALALLVTLVAIIRRLLKGNSDQVLALFPSQSTHSHALCKVRPGAAPTDFAPHDLFPQTSFIEVKSKLPALRIFFFGIDD